MTHHERQALATVLTALWRAALTLAHDERAVPNDVLDSLRLVALLLPDGAVALAALASTAGPAGEYLYYTLMPKEDSDESPRQLRLNLDTAG